MFSRAQTPKGWIGLDVGSASVKLIEIEPGPSGPRVRRAGRISIDTEDLTAGRARALEKILQGVDLRAANVVSVVDSLENCIRRVSLPDMPRREMQETLRWDLKDKLPFAPGEAELDFEVVGEAQEKGARTRLLLVAASPRKAVQEHLALVRAADILPARLIQRPIALQALLARSRTHRQGSTAVLEMGHASTELSVFHEGRLEFSRQLPVAGRHINQALTASLTSEEGTLSVKADEAERIKRAHGLRLEEAGLSRLLPLVRPVIERLASEIERSLVFYQEQAGREPVDRLLLLGSGASLKGLEAFLAGALEVKVETTDPFRLLGLGDAPEGACDMPHAFSLALGAAVGGAQGINLLPADVKDEARRKVRSALIRSVLVGMGVTAILICAGLRVESAARQKRIEAARLELSALAPSLERAREHLLLYTLAAGEPYWEDLFKELGHTLPASVYLKKLEVDKGRVSLEGVLTGADPEGLLSQILVSLEEGIFREVTLVETRKLNAGEGSAFEIHAGLD